MVASTLRCEVEDCLVRCFGVGSEGCSLSLSVSLVLTREWGNGLLGLLKGTLRDYHRDPFPLSLLRTRESFCAQKPCSNHTGLYSLSGVAASPGSEKCIIVQQSLVSVS